MKLSTFYKSHGDEVILEKGIHLSTRLFTPDIVYISCVFADNAEASRAQAGQFPHSEVHLGGSGVDLKASLPEGIEHLMPDYGLYKLDYSMGFTSRGCIRHCPFCIVPTKEGSMRPVADIYEFWDPAHKHIVLLDNNILALPEHFEKIASQIKAEGLTVDFNQGLDIRLINEENARILKSLRVRPHLRFSWDNIAIEDQVKAGITTLRAHGINRSQWYVLVGYNSTVEEDLHRLNVLKELNQRAYAMRYKTCRGQKVYDDMAAWVNQPAFFAKMTFSEFREVRNHGRYAATS
ncbi:MAG TPA: hypothetical protein VN455_06575 [Methanotrichaceae archaeon]|nr:hypothetical protein [Methanotrichaceae archaeon]